MPETSGLGSLLWALLCILLILGLAYWFTKYVVGRRLGRFPAGRSEQMRILMRTQLGRDQHLVVVQVGTRYFLVGAAPSSVTLLAEFTAEEAAAWQPPESPAGEAPPSFQEALRTVLKGKMKR